MDITAKKALGLIAYALLFLTQAGDARGADSASVKAVLFYPPFCQTCPQVIDEFLFPLSIEQGERLELYPVDITETTGSKLFEEALRQFGPGEFLPGTPSVLVGATLLNGRDQILGSFRRILEAGLASGGTDWPDLPGLQEAISRPDDSGYVQEETPSDWIAAGFAWAVMTAMLLSLLYTGHRLSRMRRGATAVPPLPWSIPIIAALGLVVSGYLSYIELTQGEPLCGPVGDCNKVQSSPYSILLGFPMAYWGLVFYLGAVVLWVTQRFLLPARQSLIAARGLLALGVCGVLFSVYLTGLELFVIHAVCMWCLTSAVLATLLMVALAQNALAVQKTRIPPEE